MLPSPLYIFDDVCKFSDNVTNNVIIYLMMKLLGFMPPFVFLGKYNEDLSFVWTFESLLKSKFNLQYIFEKNKLFFIKDMTNVTNHFWLA